MIHTRELLDSVTTESILSNEVLAAAVDVLAACETAVTACATGMLAEKDADTLRAAIDGDLDCADIVAATRRILTRHSGHDPALLTAQAEACLLACRRSHDLCTGHVEHHEHCRICADATAQAADACRNVLDAVRS
ncbi:hypothetical protein HLK59_12105 [Streptomyces sp. S3(2020)]|uniref:hypothetical protein n=1 Tax=Streptomyces sp. S3(2020) TaxID=2732044 RepID=UPI00148965FD|nr:hypothetical protein [Streptomyces sp. S3(2020)]NNN31103.1 hypothetical protein [Streptomyces sp. S3(2020)]